MVTLYEHNLVAFQEINKMLESGIKRIAAPRATGSGKTYLMGALAERFNDDKKLVLEPTRPLLNSIKEKFDEFGIANTDFITYQKLIRMSDEDIAEMDYKLIFLDECHHGTAPVWGQKTNYLMETHLDSIIFGTSATTVRNDGVNVVESLFEGNAISELPLSTAIARKVLPCPHYITAIYRLDDEFEKLKKKVENATNTKAEKRELLKKIRTMQFHFEKSYGIPTILNKYIKVRNGRYLVFCKNRKHLDTMRDVVVDWFRTAGIKDVHSYAVYSDYPDKEKDYKEFCEDSSDALKILFSINMLNEGLHIQDISGVLMLRTTLSILIYLQQLGRLLEAENIDKYLLVFDFVNNFSSVNDGIGLLKEIKDAVAREKESDPNFDDSGFEDIDTFFVLDQVLEIQEMFREIEGRLEGNWDVMFKEYCKFYEENGHGDVPKTKEYRRLNTWCKNQRSNLDNDVLQAERKQLLDENNFIWDVLKYRFEKNVFDCIAFYEKNGRLPSICSENIEERELMGRINNYKNYMSDYPQWKQNLLKMIPTLFDEKVSRFDAFYSMALIYKQKYGHVDIKNNDVIGEYKIGRIYNLLTYDHEIGKLTDEQVRKLGSLGIDVTVRKSKKRYDDKIHLAQQALSEGIVLSKKNRIYKGVDLYKWYYSHKSSFSKEQLSIFKRIICKHEKTIKIIDLRNKQANIYLSIAKVAEALYSEFNVTKNNRSAMSSILNHLSGKVTTPYKGRFMFYYATDEEVKKFLEDSKQDNL